MKLKHLFLFSIYLLLFFGLISISGCEKDFHLIKKITIKGKIIQPVRKMLQGEATDSLALSDAAKVLVFYGNEYDLAEIKKDGSFSARATLGSATAIAFLTKDNEFIGNLVVGGLNFLPLNDYELSVIDLSTLSLDGKRVIPASDPIGKSIILNEDEMNFMLEVGAYYEALAKNIDMNNDNIPDVLQNGFIAINTNQTFTAGQCGLNSDSAVLLPVNQFAPNYFMHLHGPVALLSSTDNALPENATLTGPSGNPYADIKNAGNSYSNQVEFKVNFARGQNEWLPFEKGEYTLHIDNKEFTFNYSNINMLKHWVLTVPVLITNSNNEVTDISLKFRFPNGTEANPRKLLKSGIDIQVNGKNGQQITEQLTSVYSSLDPNYDYYTIKLENPIPLSDIGSINLLYDDIFGNRGGNTWTIK